MKLMLELIWSLPSTKNTINTVNAQYLPNTKAYELQTWYTDGVRRPVSPKSAMTSKVKVTSSVLQVLARKSRTKHSRNNKIARKVAHPTGNNAHQFQGRKRSPLRLMLRSEVHHIFRTEKPINFKLGTQMEYEDLYHQQVPWPPRLKVKVTMSHCVSDRC